MASPLRILLGTILWIVALFCLAVTIVPHFLDRRYYAGPPGGHFDGARFFNPDGDDDVQIPGDAGRLRILWRQATDSDDRPAWPQHVPVVPSKPVARVEGQAMIVTWIGHASVLVQTRGLNILTDPVWSETVGPFGFGPRRVAAPGIRFEDLPKIDVVLISHNHYDHLDQATLKSLWQRDRPLVVTGLGNDSVIAQAGVPAQARDWGGSVSVKPDVSVVVTRNHHWDSRWFSDRNRALWSSFVVRLPGGNVFFAGDTGPGDLRWPSEAASYGAVRLALLPIGAFRFAPGQYVSGSHVGPPDALRVWNRLGRPFALPIHWGTFRLSYEARDTPPRMLAELMRCAGSDATRFAARDIGAAVTVPPLGGAPAFAEARLDACVRTPRVQAMR